MSSAGYIGKTTNHPDDVAASARADERNSMWGEIDGRIVSFDPVNQTATVQPLYRPKFNGKPVDMPQLLEVPVRFMRTGKGTLTFPVAAGDKVVLRPKMRSSETYHTEDDGAASDARSFSLSDMEAHLDGGESLTDPIQNFDTANTHLRANADGSHGMKMSPDGKFQFQGAEGDAFGLISQALRLIAEDQLQIAYGSSAGTGHALANRAALIAIADKLEAMTLS